MTLYFQNQEINIGDNHYIASQALLQTYENFILTQTAPIGIALHPGFKVTFFEEPNFQGEYVTVFYSCDWLLLDKIGSIKVEDSQNKVPMAKVKFTLKNKKARIFLPEGLYLNYKHFNIIEKDITIVPANSIANVEILTNGFQVVHKRYKPVIQLIQQAQTINLYKKTSLETFQSELFQNITQIQFLDDDYKLQVFQLPQFEGISLNIILSIDQLKPLDHVQSLKVSKHSYTDVFFRKMNVPIYSRTDSFTLLGLLFASIMVLIVKYFVGLNSVTKKEQQHRIT